MLTAERKSSQTAAYRTEPQRWNAVTNRDVAADGRFVFAVRTTGVYCRPGCKSRQPRRENVEFFTSPADAERAGFRACKRCKPAADGQPDGQRDAVLRACRTLETADPSPGLAELAAQAGQSPSHFQRVFKRIVGVSPKQYAAGLRTKRLRESLRAQASVTRAIQSAGFGSSSRAYEGVGSKLGMRPNVFRNGGAGERIRSTVLMTELGHVLLVASERGLCLVEFGERPELLKKRVAESFPNAEIIADEHGMAALARAFARLLSAPGGDTALPLDIQGTAFQQRVWQALRRIPAGQTLTYGALAAAIGAPRAVRAVGSACGRNRLAVAIPCHRAIGTDGKLHGYRWGLERKQRLLELENAQKNGQARRSSSK